MTSKKSLIGNKKVGSQKSQSQLPQHKKTNIVNDIRPFASDKMTSSISFESKYNSSLLHNETVETVPKSHRQTKQTSQSNASGQFRVDIIDLSDSSQSETMVGTKLDEKLCNSSNKNKKIKIRNNCIDILENLNYKKSLKSNDIEQRTFERNELSYNLETHIKSSDSSLETSELNDESSGTSNDLQDESDQDSQTPSVESRASNFAHDIKLIVSIDIGRNNLGVFVYNCITKKAVFWTVFSTGLGIYHAPQYVKQMEKIMDRIPRGSVYLIEKQVALSPKNCIVESIVHSIARFKYSASVYSIKPSTVSDYFSMTKGKSAKKIDAVKLCKQILQDRDANLRFTDIELPQKFLSKSKMKRDDLSDCMLQCLYYVDTHVTKQYYFKRKKYIHHKPRTQAATKKSKITTKPKNTNKRKELKNGSNAAKKRKFFQIKHF